MVHITFADFIFIQPVYSLLLGQRRQGTYITDLSLSAGEHGGSVHSGNNVNLCRQRTDLGNGTSVRTFVILQDHLAHGLLLILIYGLVQDRQPVLFLGKRFLQFSCHIPDILFPDLLLIGKYRCFHLFRGNQSPDLLEHFLRNGTACVGMFLLAHLCHDLVDESDDGLVDLMGLVNGFDHFRLRNFVCSGFDHDHLLPGGSHSQVQVTVLPFFLGWIDNEHTVRQPHLCHGTGTVKRNVRYRGCYRCPQHGHQFRTACRVNTHDHIVQCHIIAVILGKQGTHGSVYNPAGQHCIFAGLSFSLIKSPGDLAHCIQFLFVFYTQREKIDSFSGLL